MILHGHAVTMESHFSHARTSKPVLVGFVRFPSTNPSFFFGFEGIDKQSYPTAVIVSVENYRTNDVFITIRTILVV